MSANPQTPFQREGSAWVSKATGTRWVAVIGLEVHAQLKTRTKLFCDCEVRFGTKPNRWICPVCTGAPGCLPVINGEAVELALRAALALGADIAEQSQFDRKNYFYGDIPKNYQITQFHRPFCRGGGITLDSGQRIRLNRIHMEEDAGKSMHGEGGATLVDLNRAGAPLIESVTEADLDNARDAVDTLTALREILIYVGASNADMEKGELRCDVNVSVHPAGEAWRTKVEVKNLNSFAHIAQSIDHEIQRQILGWESGDPALAPVAETRLFDGNAGVTRTMRKKEDEADYRYTPEPDLPPIAAPALWVEELRRLLPELPAARRGRYRSQFGLSAYDAGVLTASRDVSDFFEACVRLSREPKETANWISNEILRAISGDEYAARNIDELPLKPFDLAQLIELVRKGVLHNSAARRVLREMLKSGKAAGQLVIELGLEEVRDEGTLRAWCKAALAAEPQATQAVRRGKTKALGALLGRVMGLSGGRANPQRAQKLLLDLIAQASNDG